MAIDFPSSPTNGQTFTSGSVTYTWDGTKWTAVAAGGGATDKITEGNTSAEVIDTGSDGRFVVTTEGSERLRVTAAGLVGVGTATPSNALEVNGNIRTYTPAAGDVSITHAGLVSSITAAGSISLALGTNSTERARIDTSGRLLVGTSSARSNFYNQNATTAVQIEGTTLATASLSITRNSNSASSADLIFAKTRGTSVGDNTVVQNGDLLGYIAFQGADGTECVDGAAIECRVDGTPGANDMPGRLGFYTTADGAAGPTERMRISSNGTTFFGTGLGTNLATSEPVKIAGNCGDRGGLITMRDDGVAGSNRDFIRFHDSSNNDIGAIEHNGASSVAYLTSSDYRLKENVIPLANAVNRIKQLPVHRFNFISDPNRTVDGFLAHEAQVVVPECVSGEKDAVTDEGKPIYQGIDQSKLVPLLTAALQEAIGEIESLKARVAALESA